MDELAYAYDGTLEGLLCAIFAAYANREDPSDVIPAHMLQLRLGQSVREIPTDEAIAQRVRAGICRVCGPESYRAVTFAALSDEPGAAGAAYRFVRFAMGSATPPDCGTCARSARCTGICCLPRPDGPYSAIAHPAVAPLRAIARAVVNERHRMLQFIRFEHLEGDVWFARCNPKASVVPLVMDWFAARLNTQAFIIYDEAHGIAGVYEGRTWYLVRTDQLALPDRTSEEREMRHAWKRFYDAVTVESRYYPELRRQFMPRRLWKNIVEMHEELPDRPTAPACAPEPTQQGPACASQPPNRKRSQLSASR